MDSDDEEAPVLVVVDEEENDPAVPPRDVSAPQMQPPCPVTILSGFLGSGKTTLIQYILKSPHHGKRIAVIENEFGDGLDVESMIARDGSQDNASLQELIELPNGCVCCTVKDSLVACLENLIEKRNDLDYIIIESSGMANPGPIASLFWLDDALESRLRLDGIVTMVDAKHIIQQLQETEEAAQQIAFADRILINKTDLVSSTAAVRAAISQIHPTVHLRETTFSSVPDLEWILDTQCYSVDRLEELERATKAANEFDDAHDHHHQSQHDHSHKHSHDHDHDAACSICYATEHRHTSDISTISLVETASIDLKRFDQWLASILWPNQDEQASIVNRLNRIDDEAESPSSPPPVKLASIHTTQTKGQQIYRIKGILSVKHGKVDDDDGESLKSSHLQGNHDTLDARRHIVQAVHDLWEVRPASDGLNWASDEARVCKVVVIGRRLEEEQLRAGFRGCF